VLGFFVRYPERGIPRVNVEVDRDSEDSNNDVVD
jgi:hypothetical protein